MSMDDRELLELAAKAAGIDTKHSLRFSDVAFDWQARLNRWNPLIDDGDAFRLAVKLKINISIIGKYDNEILAYSAAHHYDEEPSESMESDPYAATRRAIVRAAAEIGKGMK
jgi:hypothetical protein